MNRVAQAAIAGTKATIVKEAINAEESDTASSRGRVNLANTHPFSRPFAGGTFTLAHNGTLDEEKAPDQRGYVLASRPLTDGENWASCRPGRLLVIELGSAVFGE